MYLGTWVDGDHTELALTDDASLIVGRSHGRASAIWSASGSGDPALTDSGALLFVVPRSPTQLLARLVNDFPVFEGRVYITHGHACAVVFAPSTTAATSLLKELSADLAGWELWPYQDGRVLDAEVQMMEPGPQDGWITPNPVSPGSLHFDARSQVDQFNTNLALLSRVSSRYAPETQSLITSLQQSVQDIANQLEGLSEGAGDGDIRQGIALESALIETNSVLTLYTSQLGSGGIPLRSQTFAVGEYSLLGIGAMCRAVWRIYSHLNETFAAYDHIGTIRRHYPTARGFNPFSGSSRTDFSEWRQIGRGLEELSDDVVGPHRDHIPFFSSRWGFHEGLHSISLSWQCLYASATKEWNLLTLTHEFLHSHVRGILGHILAPRSGEQDLAETMANAYTQRQQSDGTMLESMRLAYVEALVGLSGGFNLAWRSTRTGRDAGPVQVAVSRSLDAERLQTLTRQYSDLFNELVVHVLDFRYVYDGRDFEYVNSIWSSWSLVPGVVDRIEQYVLRTLCALSVTAPENSLSEVQFEDAVERLRNSLMRMEGRSRSRHAISRAIALLDDPTSVDRLRILFPTARYVVEIARNFLLDRRLNASLVMDDLTAVVDNRRTYGVSPGEYRGELIASPLGFLLDQFQDYPDQAGEDNVEFQSIWQMLQLV